MTSITKSAKSTDDAISLALSELGVSEDMVTIEVLEEGGKGFLGLGGKDAVVRVTVKEESPDEIAKSFLNHVLEYMELPAEVALKMEDDNVMEIDISGENMGILIGHRGETLAALQYLTSLAVNRKTDEYYRVVLDTENYKKRREETLVRLAKKLAGNAVRYRRSVTLEAMSPYERRVIHATLQDDPMVSTYSTGEEPNRKVVIAYKGRK